MAENDEVFVRVELLMGARWDVAHRHGDGSGNAGKGEFEGFAHVNETGFPVADKSRRVGWGNFVIEHGFSVLGGLPGDEPEPVSW